MRITSGSTDRYVYFVAVDAADLKTRETGLTTFTVYASKNGAAAAAFTTPTVNETDATNMPGVYELLLDESTSLAAGNDTEELCLHITQAAMAPVTRTVELYRPETTEGNTLDVNATGEAGLDLDNTSGTIAAAQIEASALDGKGDWNVGKAGYSLTQAFPTNFADMSITVTAGLVDITQTAADKVFGASGAALTELSQAAPSATPRPDQALMLGYMALRNKLDVTSGFKEVHNNAGAVITKKALSDDGTTYSEAEMETGP